jgi:hypothetical protein
LKEKRSQKEIKKGKELERKSAPKESKEKLDMKFEMLPRKLQRKIEKQKSKRVELKMARKLKIDMNQPEDKILERYKKVFTD